MPTLLSRAGLSLNDRTSKPGATQGLAHSLPVRIPQHKIHAADGRDHVRDQRAFHHFRRRLQIAEARRRACERGTGFCVPSLTM